MTSLPTSRRRSAGTATADAAAAAPALAPALVRPRVQGKFLFAGEKKLWVRGVTYGTFRPDENGDLYPPRDRVRTDFAEMARLGFNAVRTYDIPPRWLLELAAENGIRVMVGLWCEHVAFLDDRRRKRSIVRRIRDGVRTLSGHPALLCYSISNEIPGSIVRWHGRRRVERYLHHLYRVIKHEDPEALVTYVSFPTTEYLRLPFLDLVCFNVYLEDRERLESYLARLQNLCGDRPLLMGEIGLDSRRNGEKTQAETLSWQVRSAFDAGCCGTFVYAWTDEWFRGGHDIEDWDFGLTRRDRAPKPALEAVRDAYADTPFPRDMSWPRISVVVCSYNGAATIRDTLDGLQQLAYPDYEVIVVNDGSTDRTREIASEYPVRLISTENRGLSNARNTGFQEATGEIVAYIDDDAYPDPHWLSYLALDFQRTGCVGVGGPNLPPAGDGPLADCVANAPGGPVQVLLTDRVAEHIPGCNMAFRKSALQEIGGFDPIYRAAGDDVDLCWRLQERGGVIGFAPSAVVWHHRRNSVRMYWKQQRGYGKAEALLERKWPLRYNAAGHLAWQGRLYGQGFTRSLATLGGRVYGGIWGSAPFQSLYSGGSNTWL
jgi:GT2 family glycosyltransferase